MMRQTPMMSNPFEYRETLWNILYVGERPPPKAPTKPGAKALPRGRGGEMTATDRAKLAAHTANIARIQEKRAAEGLPVPQIERARPVPTS